MDMPMREQTDVLRDSFSRQIDYLRISITDRCNLKCVYCMPERGLKYFQQQDLLTTEETARIVRIAHKCGVRKVRITGGEPLMREDIIPLVSAIKEIGVRDLSMTTNGILLADMAEALKRAGLDRVNISLDTLDAERYRTITRGGNIYNVWNAIDEAEKAGLTPIKINFVPLRGINDDEVVAFASLAFQKDYHVRFIEFMPIGNKKMWRRKLYLTKNEIMEKVSSLGGMVRLPFKGKGPSRNYRIEGAKGIIGIISPISDCFCDHCNRLRLTAAGTVRPCLFSDGEVDMKTPLRNGATDDDLGSSFITPFNPNRADIS